MNDHGHEAKGLEPAKPARRRGWRNAWPWVKWTLFLIVMLAVGRRAVELWRTSPQSDLNVDVRWLIPAAGLYLVGWLPSVWFWQALLKRMHQPAPHHDALRAYFVGHVGKYLPGKALVLILRGSLLKEAGANPIVAGITAAYETLIFMSAGAALAVALAPQVIGDSLWQQLPATVQVLRQQPLLLPFVVAAATFACTPFSSRLFTWVGNKAMGRGAVTNGSDGPAPSISAGLLSLGVVVTSVGWLCHALSLGCTLQAVSNRPFDLTLFPVWLAGVCLSTVGGFVVLFAPGGLGVREGLLIEVLKDQSTIGPAQALVAAGLLRGVWFFSELAAAGVFWFLKPSHPKEMALKEDTLKRGQEPGTI